MSVEPTSSSTPARQTPVHPLLRAATYPSLYTWYVFFASLDIMLTWLILHFGGREENAVADWILRQFNLPGMVAFKFAMVVLVILICEVLGRQQFELGLRVARWAVLVSAFPVVVGAGQLLLVALAGPETVRAIAGD